MKRMKLHYKSKLRKTIIAPALVSFFCVSAAQSQTVRGVVTDAASGEPLGYVTVKAVEAKTGTLTNDKGEYEIQNLPVDRYTIETTAVGCVPCWTQQDKVLEPYLSVGDKAAFSSVRFRLYSLGIYPNSSLKHREK